MNENPTTLLEWLNAPCLPEDLDVLPWDMSVNYMSIQTVRKKFKIMETQFKATVEQVSVNISAINTQDKDTCFMATVKFIVYHPEFHNGQKTFCGAASFLRGQHPKGWAFAQIAESLATTRAFNKEFAQFGKDANTKNEDDIKGFSAPKNISQNSNAVKGTLTKLP